MGGMGKSLYSFYHSFVWIAYFKMWLNMLYLGEESEDLGEEGYFFLRDVDWSDYMEFFVYYMAPTPFMYMEVGMWRQDADVEMMYY